MAEIVRVESGRREAVQREFAGLVSELASAAAARADAEQATRALSREIDLARARIQRTTEENEINRAQLESRIVALQRDRDRAGDEVEQMRRVVERTRAEAQSTIREADDARDAQLQARAARLAAREAQLEGRRQARAEAVSRAAEARAHELAEVEIADAVREQPPPSEPTRSREREAMRASATPKPVAPPQPKPRAAEPTPLGKERHERSAALSATQFVAVARHRSALKLRALPTQARFGIVLLVLGLLVALLILTGEVRLGVAP